jgi:HD-GYP domain-containing protein (c-di-GMP phosphodiesterase class II)
MGQAISTGLAVFAAHHRVSTADDQLTVWRYAVPVSFENEVGVAALDLESDCTPQADNINLLFAQMRLGLTAALALYVARARTESAHAVLEASRDLSRTLDPDRVIADALDRAMGLADAATGSVMLLDADGLRLEMRTARGLPNRVSRSTTLAMGEGIAGWVAASGQPLLVEDLPGTASRGQRHGVRSAVSVPIGDEDGLLGVLNVGSRSYPARFTENHLEALEAIGKQTAIALRNAWAVTAAGEMFFDTLKALALALETKDPYASGGTERMLELSTALGKALHLPEPDQRAIEIAAMLHDLGMGAMGDGVASTARPLSTVERGLLKMHPVIAADVLDQAPALKAVVPIVYHHHEHYDGTGYTGGLAGETIPLGSRMLSVVDAYVAMTSDRPYRQALTPQKALEELREKAGSQFDPDVVEVFASIVDREGRNVNDRSL